MFEVAIAIRLILRLAGTFRKGHKPSLHPLFARNRGGPLILTGVGKRRAAFWMSFLFLT
jgi:hypothetical protein